MPYRSSFSSSRDRTPAATSHSQDVKRSPDISIIVAGVRRPGRPAARSASASADVNSPVSADSASRPITGSTSATRGLSRSRLLLREQLRGLPDVAVGALDRLRRDGVGLVQHGDRVDRPCLAARGGRGERGERLLVVGAHALRHDVEHGLGARDRVAGHRVEVAAASSSSVRATDAASSEPRPGVSMTVRSRSTALVRYASMCDTLSSRRRGRGDHAVRVERQHLLAAVVEDDLDAVDRAVLEAGDQPGALADVRRRDPAADQGVDQRGLAGLDPPGDRDLQRRGQPAQHLAEAGGGPRGDLRLQRDAQVGHRRRQRSGQLSPCRLVNATCHEALVVVRRFRVPCVRGEPQEPVG